MESIVPSKFYINMKERVVNSDSLQQVEHLHFSFKVLKATVVKVAPFFFQSL